MKTVFILIALLLPTLAFAGGTADWSPPTWDSMATADTLEARYGPHPDARAPKGTTRLRLFRTANGPAALAQPLRLSPIAVVGIVLLVIVALFAIATGILVANISANGGFMY